MDDPNPSPGSRRFGGLARLVTFVGSLLLALLVAEGAIRLLRLAPGIRPIALAPDVETVYRRSTNPILSFELKPGYRNDDPDLQYTYPSTNAHGQRDVERPLEKPEGVRRILLLGDSVVEGHGVREIDDLISRRLEALYPPGSVEVLNFGVSGYCTLAEVELLEVKGLAFDPDVVILLFTENDYNNFVPERGRATELERPAIVDQLVLRSHLARLAGVRWNLFHLGARADPVSWNRGAIGDNNVVTGLQRLQVLSARHGFDVRIAVWPRFEDAAIRDMYYVSEDSDDLIIERLAWARGIPTIRLSEVFREDRRAIGPEVNPRLRYTIGDGLHPSVEGCRVAARGLKAMLAAPLPSPPTGGPEVGRTAAAIDAARRAGLKRPTYAATLVNAGQAHEERGELEAARELYEQALEIEPENTAALYNVGAVLAKQGQHDAAIAWYSRALAVDPDYYRAHKGLGVAYLFQQRYAAAIEQLRLALRRRPRDADTHHNLGTAHMQRNELEQAERSFRNALSIDPGHASAQNSLGIVYARAGRLDLAEERFEAALKIRPDFQDAARNLAQLRAVRGTDPD